MSAECTGSAYMSGSKPRDHRKSVRYRATTRDINTYSKGKRQATLKGERDQGQGRASTHCEAKEKDGGRDEGEGEPEPIERAQDGEEDDLYR